jgi:hypothetical protein
MANVLRQTTIMCIRTDVSLNFYDSKTAILSVPPSHSFPRVLSLILERPLRRSGRDLFWNYLLHMPCLSVRVLWTVYGFS